MSCSLSTSLHAEGQNYSSFGKHTQVILSYKLLFTSLIILHIQTGFGFPLSNLSLEFLFFFEIHNN